MTINGQIADFNDSSDLAPRITKRLFNGDTLDSVSGDHAINVNLPLTFTNRTIFSFIDNVSTNKTFYDLRIFNIVITLDGDDLISGILKIQQISDNFECIIIGSSISWMSYFKQHSLREIFSYRKPYWSGNKSIGYANNWIDPALTGNPTVTPTWWNETRGYSDLWEVTVSKPFGELEGENFDFATPLISYGNFTIPLMIGRVEQGAFIGAPGVTVTIAGTILATVAVLPVGVFVIGNGILPGTFIVSLGVAPNTYNINLTQSQPFPTGVGVYAADLVVSIAETDVILNADIFTSNGPTNGAQITGQISQAPGAPLLREGRYSLTRGFTLGDSDFSFVNYAPTPTATGGGYFFYNTEKYPAGNLSSFYPSPYLTTTIRRMFADIGYNCSGNFFTDSKYLNQIIPFCGADDRPLAWNWGIMGRLNVDYFTNSGAFGQGLRFGSSPELPSGVASTTTFGNTYTVITNGKQQQFYRFTTSFQASTLSGNLTPANAWQQTLNENYSYNTEYPNQFDALGDRRAYTFNSPTDCAEGQFFNIRYIIRGFGARPNIQGGQLADWNQTAVGGGRRQNDRYFMMIVRRSDDSFKGRNNLGLIFWNGADYVTGDGNIVTTPGDYDFSLSNSEVMFVRTFAINALSNTLNATDLPVQDFSVTDTFLTGETAELIFVFGNADTDDTQVFPFTRKQGISMNRLNTSSLIVTPIGFQEQLNVADWLSDDINMADFLKTTLNTYNLFISYDKISNTIDIADYAHNFLSSGTSVDWTEKCNINSTTSVISPLNEFKEINFNMLLDTNDYYRQLLNPYQFKINNSPNFIDKKDINNLFSTTQIFNYRHYSRNANSFLPATLQQKLIPIPTMSTTDVAQGYVLRVGHPSFGISGIPLSTDFNIRLLKYEGVQDFNTAITPGPQQNLLWIEEISYTKNGFKLIPQAGLVDFNFIGTNGVWIEWLLLVENNININLPVYLLTRDISTLDLRKPVTIGNNTYIISSIIGYNIVEDGTTQVNLIKSR